MTTLAMIRGDTETFELVLAYNGQPVDLTDCAITFTAKYRHSDADDDAVISKTIGDGIAVLDAIAGTAEVRLSPADTAGLSGLTRLVWDIQLVDAVNAVHTVASGEMTIAPDVTRATS